MKMVDKSDPTRSLDETLAAIYALFAADGPHAEIKDGFLARANLPERSGSWPLRRYSITPAVP